MQTNQKFVPLGYQQITSLASAAKLTVPQGATMAILEAETEAVRWRDDGTAPTASIGMLLETDTPYEYSGDLSAIQFIATTSGAVLDVSYYQLVG